MKKCLACNAEIPLSLLGILINEANFENDQPAETSSAIKLKLTQKLVDTNWLTSLRKDDNKIEREPPKELSSRVSCLLNKKRRLETPSWE